MLGRPCYAKFKAIPNYTYLKLKMPGPVGVITVGPMYYHAYECDVECVDYAKSVVHSKALIVNLENLCREVPDAKKHANNFEPTKATETVPLDSSGSGEKVLRIGSYLEPK